MKVLTDGGPAFPTMTYELPGECPSGTIAPCTDQPGMTLRDWFAGQALQKLAVRLLRPGETSSSVTRDVQLLGLTGDCYAIADAMIAAREK